MQRRKPGRAWRILVASLLAIVALLALALVGLATPPGRSLVAGIIERAGASAGVTVRIDHLTGWLPFSIGADKIVLADADGPFAEIDGLNVDVQATALITGRLSLDAITADRIAIQRRPHLPGGGGSGSGSSGGAALPFAARNVRVARLELGKALAGRPAVLAVTGALASGADGSLAAKLDARRIDGSTGTLTAVAERASGKSPLTATVQLHESADGILLGLIGRPSGPAYTLDAKVASRGDALTGDLSLTSGGAAHFAGKFTLSPAGAGTRLVLDGKGDLAELVPPDYAGLVGGPLDVAIDADWANVKGSALPRIVLRQGEITTGSVHATATGTLDGQQTDLKLAAKVADPAGGAVALPFLGAGAEMKSLSLTGTGAPSGDAIRLQLVGQVAGLRMDGVSVPGTGLSLAVESRPGESLAGKLPFGVRVEVNSITTPTGELAATAAAPLLLTATGTLDTATGVAETQAHLAAGGGTLAFTGTAAAGTIKGRATVAVPDLAPLSPLAGRTLAGAVRATIDGTIVAAEPAFTVKGTATDLALGDARLARLLAGTTTFAAKVQGQSGGGIAVSDLVVDGAGITARGSATLAKGTVSARLDGALADLGRLADQSSGAATFTVRASGAVARPQVEAQVAVASGRLLDQSIRNASIDLKGAPTDTGWQATLGLGGSLAGGRLAGTAIATVDRSDGAFALPKVDLSVGGNRITGAVARTPAGLLSGDLKVDAPDLRTLAALALVTASGQGQAAIRLQPEAGGQSVAVTFKGSGIAWQSVTVGTVDGTATIADAFRAPQVHGTASASAVSAGGRRFDSIDATASVAGGQTRIAASAKGPDIDLSAAAHLAQAALTVDTLKGTAFGTPVALSQPVTVVLGGGQTRIAGAALTVGSGSLGLDGSVSPQLDLTVTATRLPASVVNGFAPDLGADGSVTARARISGQPAAPSFDWQADWSGFALAATRKAGLPALAINASGKGTIAATSVSAKVTGAGLALAVDGRVPFGGSGLDVKASGSVPLALLALSTSRELRLAGDAKVDVTVGGALAAPAVNGTVDLANATVIDSQTGFGISGASGRIGFDGHQATIQQISGRFSQGGTVTVAGSITTDQSDLPADLTIRIDNGRYADGSVVNTTFSGDLAIKGPLLGNGSVSGKIDLGRTQIQLPDRIGASQNAIAVRHINAPPSFTPPLPRQRPQSVASAPAGGGLNLDVALTGNSGIYVRGFGIDAEFGGSLKIGGTTNNPQAVGAFTLQRGRMDAVGQRFTFTQGTLTFSGSLVPVVDFSATTTTSDATVTLSVTGPATDPQISLTSSPSMPEEEILSRLLFNQGVGTLSPAQALQLVDAVGQLTGVTGSGGIIARIRNATGLDDLDIRQSASGGTTVGIGKQLNDKIRLGVEAGTGSASGRVTIDLNITKHLKASGSAGQDGSGQVGLTYERDY